MTTPIPLVRYGTTSSQIPACLEKIIYKKIYNIALKCFERLAHWALTTFSRFYPAYTNLYNLQIASHQRYISRLLPEDPFVDTAGLLDGFPDKELRLQHFSDGTGILDLTEGRICRRTTSWRFELNGREVIFNHDEESDTQFGEFGKELDTEYVTIEDSRELPGRVKITEHKTFDRIIQWVVDTNKRFINHRMVPAGVSGFMFCNDPSYVTEDVIPNLKGDKICIE